MCAQDVDEYIWAPEYERLVDYLAAQTANVSQVTALELRFRAALAASGAFSASF